jgi:small subunit ribosomal protein S16
MAVRIRLARHGTTKKPFYRIVVTDQENPRDGKFLEVVGTYDPRHKTNRLTLKRERIDHWIKKGAKASQTVGGLLKEKPQAS